jgi:hypothetical protein
MVTSEPRSPPLSPLAPPTHHFLSCIRTTIPNMSPTLQALCQHFLVCLQEGINIILWAENTPCRIAWFVCIPCLFFSMFHLCPRPLHKNGRRVHPFDLPAWLSERKLVWMCLCPADNLHGACLACFRIGQDGSTFAVCGGVDSLCDFKRKSDYCAQS